MQIRSIYLVLTLILFTVSCGEQDDDQISSNLDAEQRDAEVNLEGQGTEGLELDEESEADDRDEEAQAGEEPTREEQAGEEQAGEELTVISDREVNSDSSSDSTDQPDQPDQPDTSDTPDTPDTSDTSNTSDPSDPSDSSDPSDPSDPSDSSDPSDPSDQTDQPTPSPGEASPASVLCGEEACDLATHTCCLREFGTSCVEGANVACDLGGTPLICDGPEDCGGGQCCLGVGLPGALECSPTPCVNLTLCHADPECAEDQVCRRCQFTGVTLSVCSRPNVIPNLALSCE